MPDPLTPEALAELRHVDVHLQRMQRQAATKADAGMIASLRAAMPALLRAAEERDEFNEEIAACREVVGARSERLRVDLERLVDERDEARAERDRYLETLLSRHGGEPVMLLRELDEAREQRDGLVAAVARMFSLDNAETRDAVRQAVRRARGGQA